MALNPLGNSSVTLILPACGDIALELSGFHLGGAL
jgi:hypothetical protein